ncbi:Bug family tripartite tricarboxylate transporter substrate binding protein [Ramlibacter algicola]|uniref:Tripartite tricarboxylate transporter substrate binding protein n=1 Tax=Ramlibacter algicola TaxID=2795217 RepID=A0A934Q0Q5_9BURK|nr:tripartite tricarboxylate transporter substrate-binding protein [Ramlibacter algicola]MBK0392686.1 tripartite tricarboxylate transporter substrate binding protein [Ramlibacter algicola]
MRLVPCLVVLASLQAAAVHSAPRTECIVPAKAEGGFDLTCQLLRDMLRLPSAAAAAADVEIRYLPGGIGAVAFDRAVTQRWSDPRTVVAFSTGSLVNLAQGKFGPHSPEAVRWLATLGTEYGVVAVRRNSQITSLETLRMRLRADPAGLVFGAGGAVGSQDWIKAALLVKAAGKDHRVMRFVSFEGGGQAVAALRAGHVDVFCGDAAEATKAFLAGELKLVAVLAPHRLAGPLAQVPTAREQGVDLVWPTVRGLYMGPDVPAHDYDEWVRTLRRIMSTPEFARASRARDLEPFPMVGSEVQQYVRAEVARMRDLARSLHLPVR